MPDRLFLNGHFLPLSEGRISVEDRGFFYADGVYDVVRISAGHPFTLHEHLTRFGRSAAGILLEPPRPVQDYAGVIQRLIEESGYTEAYAYGQLTRGAAPRSHYFPAPTTPVTELWYIKPLKPYPTEMIEGGTACITVEEDRWNHCDLKTIALLSNTLARERARRAGAFEAIYVSEHGIVHEGAACNVLIVQQGTLVTHPLTSKILPGITRDCIKAYAKTLGIPFVERPFTAQELFTADEVMLSSTTMDAMAVSTIDGRTVGGGRLGPVTRRLRECFAADYAALGQPASERIRISAA